MSIAQVIIVIAVNTREDDSNWVNGIIFPWTYKLVIEWKVGSTRITGDPKSLAKYTYKLCKYTSGIDRIVIQKSLRKNICVFRIGFHFSLDTKSSRWTQILLHDSNKHHFNFSSGSYGKLLIRYSEEKWYELSFHSTF